jgi:hypothetical protein
MADMCKKTAFRVNWASTNWRPSDTEISTRVDTFDDADATNRLELTEYKDKVTKNKECAERVEVNGKVRACKT